MSLSVGRDTDTRTLPFEHLPAAAKRGRVNDEVSTANIPSEFCLYLRTAYPESMPYV